MTTTIEINDNLVNEALKYANIKSKKKLFFNHCCPVKNNKRANLVIKC